MLGLGGVVVDIQIFDDVEFGRGYVSFDFDLFLLILDFVDLQVDQIFMIFFDFVGGQFNLEDVGIDNVYIVEIGVVCFEFVVFIVLEVDEEIVVVIE